MFTWRFHYWNDDVLSFAFVDAETEEEATEKFYLVHGNEDIVNVTKI